jgi:AcrR family transcriptional regulator
MTVTLIAPPDVRDRILSAALQVLRTEGVRKFSQPRVAEEAKVRQSHLTYYFPARADLLKATCDLILDGVTTHIAEAAATIPNWGSGPMLGMLARQMTGVEHMRMFLAMIIEADGDPDCRLLVQHGSARVHAALTEALGGGPEAAAKARVAQVTIWGLGLYTFAHHPDAESGPLNDTLDMLEDFVR